MSEGTNGYCGVQDCCEWYPKETKAVVFCSPKRPLLNWFPLDAGTKCSDVTDKETQAKIGVEIIKGAVSLTFLYPQLLFYYSLVAIGPTLKSTCNKTGLQPVSRPVFHR